MGRHHTTYKEAIKAADAEELGGNIQYKLDSCLQYDTWELIKLLRGHKAIKSKWVFKLKLNGCFYAHMLAKVFMQILTLIMMKTFS
jgi:hypothetical protein